MDVQAAPVRRTSRGRGDAAAAPATLTSLASERASPLLETRGGDRDVEGGRAERGAAESEVYRPLDRADGGLDRAEGGPPELDRAASDAGSARLSQGSAAGPVGESAADLSKKYAVAAGKMTAGVCRFLFEDVLQCGCQGIWLCKKWKEATMYVKAFTMCSIGSGLFLSFAVPLKEYLDMRRLGAATKEADPKAYEMMSMAAADEVDLGEGEGLGEQFQGEQMAPSFGKQVPGPSGRQYPAKMNVSKFLSGRSGHGKKAHIGLMMSALVFWGYIAVYPKLFKDKISCEGNPPAMGLQIFFGLFVADLVLQVWVLIHTENGYNMLINDMWGFAGGTLFSLLGRFDTYGDVSFTYKLLQCESITWFSIWDHVYTLPCPLEYFAIFALVIGVLCLQAIPGLLMLCCKKNFPLALKFNEFNLILTVMSQEKADEDLDQGPLFEQEGEEY